MLFSADLFFVFSFFFSSRKSEITNTSWIQSDAHKVTSRPPWCAEQGERNLETQNIYSHFSLMSNLYKKMCELHEFAYGRLGVWRPSYTSSAFLKNVCGKRATGTSG